MATELVRVIDPDGGEGSDYSSANAWEAAFGGVGNWGDLVVFDLIAVAKCRCSGGTADAPVQVSGWLSSSPSCYPKIWTDTADTGGAGRGGNYRHKGFYPGATDNIYRIEGEANCIYLSVPYSKVHGIAVNPTFAAGTTAAVYINTLGCEVSHCLVKGSTGGSYDFVSGIYVSSSCAGRALVHSNIVYDITGTGSYPAGIDIESDASQSVYIYCNTVVDCTNGIRRSGTAGTCKAINNVVHGCTDSFAGTFSTGTATNAYSEGSDPGTGGIDISGAATLYFDDPTNDDFLMNGRGCALADVGTNVYADANCPVTKGICGNARPSDGAFDVGADEEVASDATGSATVCSGLSVAGAGTLRRAVPGVLTLAGITVSGSVYNLGYGATGAITLGSSTVDGVVTRAAYAMGAVSTSPAQASGVGTHAATATGAVSIIPVQVVGDATQSFIFTGAVTTVATLVSGKVINSRWAPATDLLLGTAAIVGIGTRARYGTGAITTGTPAAAAGVVTRAAYASAPVTISGVTVAAICTHSSSATGVVTLSMVTADGVVTRTATATASVTTSATTVAALGKNNPQYSTGVVAFSTTTVSGVATRDAEASGAIALGASSVTASATCARYGTGSIIIHDVTSCGIQEGVIIATGASRVIGRLSDMRVVRARQSRGGARARSSR